MGSGHVGILFTDYLGIYGGMSGGNTHRSRYFFHGGVLFPRTTTIGTLGGGLALLLHQREPEIPFDLALVPMMDVSFWSGAVQLELLLGIQSGFKIPIEGADRPLWMTGAFALGPYYTSVNLPGGRVGNTSMQYRFTLGFGYWITRKLNALVELYFGRYNDGGFGLALGFR
jgi:hypothetical protein